MKEGSEGLERFTSRAVKSAAMDAPIDESTILAAETLLGLSGGTLNTLITRRKEEAQNRWREAARGQQEPQPEARQLSRRSALPPPEAQANLLKEARRYRFGGRG